MKKRLICICLCVVTLLSLVLTGCSTQSDDEIVKDMIRQQSKDAYTLTMWVVSEKEVDAETVAEVTSAVNDLTRTKYNVNLVIKYFTADEYYTVLDQTLAAYSASATGKVPALGDFDVPADGLYEAIYRDEQPNQVDIIYIGDLKNENGDLLMSGEEMYNDLRSKGHLADISGYLSNATVAKIYEYIAPTLLEAVKEEDATFAIPNNNVIGEYTYMLLNKELMERYSMQGKVLAGQMNSFYSESVYQYLNMVLADRNNDGVVLPVDASYEDCLSMLAYYWSVDPDDFSLNSDSFSIFGSVYGALGSIKRGETLYGTASLFEDPQFVSAYLQLNKYRLNNEQFFRTSENESVAYTDVALKFCKGDLDDLTVVDGVSYYYEGDECYYAVPVRYPSVETEDVYDSMFGVCAYAPTEQIESSMEILAYLNTDAEIRNLLQYGVEEEYYNVIDGNVVRTDKGEKYVMDLFTTGNAFITYPESWMSNTVWENGKEQNRDAQISPMLGFDLVAEALANTSVAGTFKEPQAHRHSLTYYTGLSKESFDDNLLLKAWIESCDKKANGVYMYKTITKVNKNYYATYYVYNTMGASSMMLETDSITDKAKKETGLDITLAYKSISTTDTSVRNYELSVISYTFPTDYKGSIGCTVDGKKTTIVTETKNRNMEFDLLNTANYTVNAYTDLSMAYFCNNATIYNQLIEWKEAPGNVPTNYVLTWEETEADGSVKYHYVVYRKNISYATSTLVYPVGGETTPTLKLQYTAYDGVEPTGSYRDYALCYVCISGNANVVAGTPIFAENGVTDTARTELIKVSEDIGFDMVGALDTELVKYAAALNDEIKALLDACTTYGAFETLVNDLCVLLNTTTPVSVNDAGEPVLQSDALVQTVMNGVVGGDFETLYKNLCHMTSSATMQDPEDPDADVIEELGESRIYYFSPFGIYYTWAEKNGYLPEKK